MCVFLVLLLCISTHLPAASSSKAMQLKRKACKGRVSQASVIQRKEKRPNSQNGGKIAICELKDIQVKDLVGCNLAQLVHDLSCCQCCWNPLGSLAAKPADYGGDRAHVVNGSTNLKENVDNKKPRDRGAESSAFVRVWLGAASTEGDTPRYGSGARVQEIANAHDGAVSFELKSATADRKRDHKLGKRRARVSDDERGQEEPGPR